MQREACSALNASHWPHAMPTCDSMAMDVLWAVPPARRLYTTGAQPVWTPWSKRPRARATEVPLGYAVEQAPSGARDRSALGVRPGASALGARSRSDEDLSDALGQLRICLGRV